jgi:hypothetical protein
MSSIQWLTPRPLWPEFAAPTGRESFRRPAILRFAKDTFMEDLQQILTKRAGDLKKYVARPETWREPVVGLGATAAKPLTPGLASLAFRLYQPLHMRFYVVTASLTCRVPGQPDHTVKPDEGETVAYVIRRVEALPTSGATVTNPTTRQEYAWIEGEAPGWRQISTSGIADGEQQLPMFPMAYAEDGQRRRVLGGLIPVGKRQEYISARTLPASGQPVLPSGSATSTTADPRLIDLQRKVIDPWAEQIDGHGKMTPAQQANPAIKFSFDQGAALILLDFVNYLIEHAPEVGNAVASASAPLPTGAGLALYNTLAGKLLVNQDTATAVSMLEAMRKAKQREAAFESATLPANATPSLPAGYPRVSLLHATALTLMQPVTNFIRPIQPLVAAALTTPAPVPGPRPPAANPTSPVGDAWFVARCVYRRPKCGVNAIPLVSDPTEPFQLASIFDANAPARPSQVALPLDTTPAGLRKHDKSVAFMISDELAKQMARIKGLKELTDGEVGSPGIGIGFICSLSIPIITLCAFIVLMIFIALLNIIFWWLPFFKICFPIPIPAKESN